MVGARRLGALLSGRGLATATLKVRAVVAEGGDTNRSVLRDGPRDSGSGTAVAMAKSRTEVRWVGVLAYAVAGVLIRDGSAVLDLEDWW